METESRLTFLNIEPSDRHKKRRGLFRCICGNEIVINLSSVKRGITKSCGCFRKEVTAKNNTTHGMTHHPIHGIWTGMKSRCNNKNAQQYCDYGGRGIVIEWDSFDEFYADMGASYIKGYSIERIDVNGNYSKENCTWIPLGEQAYNTRKTVRVMIDGKERCLSEVCRERGLVYERVRQRITKLGWNPEDAVAHEGCNVRKDNKRCAQYSLQGDLIKRFNSIHEASLETGVYREGISKCCRGIMSSTMGYIWLPW